MPASRTPGQRAGLSLDVVLAAAQSIISARGLEALTMRALAHDLGVAPNAIYSHVSSKTALVDALLDDVLAEVAEPGTVEPAPGLRALMISTYDVLLAHESLVPVYVERQGSRGPNAQRLGVVMDGLLDRAGITGALAGQARGVLIVHTIGFAAFAVTAGSPTPDRPSLARGELDSAFVQSLDWLLTGIFAG